MNETETLEKADADTGEYFDVLIIGAGISGVGSAYHLQTQCPGKSYVILETKDTFGGTWVTHTYPGIRSDSDLYTFGYRFKPWVGAPIASAEEILKYMGEVIEENALDEHIRYRHRIDRAEWSSTEKLWRVDATDFDTGETKRFSTSFLWACQGYYHHEQGYTPDWPGMEDFQGQIVHPQTWPEDIDLSGKKVVCIGSGATAATLVPAIADECEHVTLLQRSPTYFYPASNQNELADRLRQIGIEEETVHRIVRQQILFDQDELTRRCQTEPDAVRQELLEGVKAYLGEDYPIEEHFGPTYRPWQQRLAFLPDGDMFQGIAAGKASVVTDTIECFTETGIQLTSGQHLDADIIITATGFNLSVLGNIDFAVDGKPVDFAETVTWRGMMFTGVPNLVWVFGYFRASWTLRVDMLGDFVCRLLNHMDAKGARQVEVALSPEEETMERLPWGDPDDFNPGYLMRRMHLLPKRLDKYEWQHTQDYWREKDEFPKIDLDGPALKYS